ncbi:hypothetical protein N7510_008404 [Penicillium lagena]|uniref:uncharacterized protein n=1 Tax=Penicillium lagena TaxID=94218 RepID=UPI00254138FE|nr:uncharacterized protein N7510_008404 [Penicillium lagena]KAJ5605623.1 hypothetical protein N7510_008404 [Penicillium lagena]
MAEAPLESSSTPPSATSESTRPGGPMEEQDPQTRKRPRLDSGSRVSESLAIDDERAPAAPAVDMDETPDIARPPSKVTINVKSPTSDMPSGTDTPIEQTEVAPEPQPTPHDAPISISSSPDHTPEIEVAELEDIGQDPNMSNWRPLEKVLQDTVAPEAAKTHGSVPMINWFPRVRENMGPRENLGKICIMIDKGDPHDAGVLVATKHWLDDCAGNLDRLTAEVFAEDHEFWEELPSVVEALLRRQQPIQLDAGQSVWSFLEDFFVAFARITLHLLRLDTLILNRVSNVTDIQLPDSLSRQYLQPLAWTIQLTNIPFFRTLDRLHDTEVVDLLICIRNRVSTAPIDAPSALSDYVSLVISLLPKYPQLSTMLINIFLVICPLVDRTLERKQNDESTIDLPVMQILYETVRMMDEAYREHITKKSPWLTSEMSDQFLRFFCRSYLSFCHFSDEYLQRLSTDLSVPLPQEITSEESGSIIWWAWRFSILKKHIMDGRMELRVLGVETMQSDLVGIWRQHLAQNPDGVSLPFIQYLVRFLRDSKLVDYIVGVDSHPQLISRSSNIVGFLVVTSSYTNADTDIIWKTVTESQDSRTISEVLSMLMRTLPMHASASSALLYVCAKLLEFPLERFDSRIVDFCHHLLQNVREKHFEKGRYDLSEAEHVDPIPLRLCVRLIRESAAATDLAVEQKTMMQKFGSTQLREFIKAGLSEVDKMEMYERCIQDIAEMNEFTAGSIQALNALVPMPGTQEIWKLATEFDLTRLVIAEFAHIVGEGQVNFGDPFSHHGFISRVQILSRLIDMAPDTIDSDLGNTLWNGIFMSKTLDPQGRMAVWDMLCTVTGRTGKPNTFVERCIQEYLPALLPEDYSPEVLAFAKQSIHYDVRFNPPPIADENEVVTIPGMERVWQFILTAPSGSIETEATNYAIEVYLDHNIIRRSPRSAVEATHISIVERCVDQLKSAAAILKSSSSHSTISDGTMEIDSSQGGIGAQELGFRRSLLFLRQLLHGLRTRPQYSPRQRSPPRLPDRPLKGDSVDISYQWFDGANRSGVNILQIGDLSTATELVERLTHLTGFSKFAAICGGHNVELLKDPRALVKDLNFLSGLLILRKIPEAPELARGGRRQPLTSVDAEVLKHFDELYDLLDLKDDLAHEIYDFLVVFPPQDRVRELVRSESRSDKDLFPLEKPFNALYSMNTLSACLREESVEVSPNPTFVAHSIQVLVSFLAGDGLLESLAANSTRFFLVTSALECLVVALPVYHPASDEDSLVQDPALLVQRLVDLIDIGRHTSSSTIPGINIQRLICNSFGVLIEGSLSDQKFWSAVKQHVKFDELLCSLLLEECRQPIRHEIAERIKMTCSPSKSFKQSAKLTTEDPQNPSPLDKPARIDMLAIIWSAFVQDIPKTTEHASQSAEFFRTALWVLQSVAEKSPRDLIFGDYVKQWSEIMLSHRTEEFVGREPVDDLILGFAHLLELCLDLADSAQARMDTADLAEKILATYLFPDLSEESSEPIVPQAPVMHNLTRQKLYNIINLLCKRNDDVYANVLDQLEAIVPRDYTYVSSTALDRSKMLRAPEGYAGLKNLSNTCYLNSLMTQLFMNVEFREFILGLQPADPGSSQKLLYETQRLFSWMQETWMKSLEPQEFVDSIRTYDNEAIDVTIQMDVDEFYNLLFDRWEAQVLDLEDKKKFRSFYGGQLVQQIKSKECEHISERLEPFSAIQCDIKGKTSLEESLQAYVEGEVMQGDNKYSCTSCGRHVDAVKRACLKEVPDNLIFHLKRFDFDMVTMMRSKINDEFQFPHRIDMAPFKVEYLSDSNASIEPDVFELVGVLVHTGTAESGHYYSYMRERPTASSVPSWVEFNDSDVSRFDPAAIADQCFGGQSESHSVNGVRLNKVWNAYMLFYQRVSTMEQSNAIFRSSKGNVPAHVPIPTVFGNHIAIENELHVRSYCLLDPYYTFFVQQLLRRLDTVALTTNRDKVIGLAVDVGMDTLEQLVARTKDAMGLENLFTEIFQILGRTPYAAYRVLDWVCGRPTSIRNLILRGLHSEVRVKGSMLVVGALKQLHTTSNDSELDESDQKMWRSRFEYAFDQVAEMLDNLWPALQSAPRPWDDYHEFLNMLTEFGPWAMRVLLDKGIFMRCLEIIWLEGEDRKRLRGHYSTYCRLLEKGRRFSHRKLLDLCSLFFKRIDLTLPPTMEDEDRIMSADGRFSVNLTESSFIKSLDKDGSLILLTKIITHHHWVNTQACRNIVSLFLEAEPEAGLLGPICQTLEAGLRVSPADLCTPFLDSTILFCRRAPDEERIIAMIDFVAKGVETINNSGGLEHLEFFTHLCRLSNERANLDHNNFTQLSMEKIPDWAPTLLIDKDRNVRHATISALSTLLFSDTDEANDEYQARCATIARELMTACVNRIDKSFLHSDVQTVESRIVEAVIQVINHCLETFYDESKEEDKKVIQEATGKKPFHPCPFLA